MILLNFKKLKNGHLVSKYLDPTLCPNPALCHKRKKFLWSCWLVTYLHYTSSLHVLNMLLDLHQILDYLVCINVDLKVDPSFSLYYVMTIFPHLACRCLKSLFFCYLRIHDISIQDLLLPILFSPLDHYRLKQDISLNYHLQLFCCL